MPAASIAEKKSTVINISMRKKKVRKECKQEKDTLKTTSHKNACDTEIYSCFLIYFFDSGITEHHTWSVG